MASPPYSYENQPTDEPDIRGPTGRAWRMRPSLKPWQEATITAWLLECPASNPMWWWYLIFAVHLRPGDGLQPAHVQFPGATHELIAMALDPSKPLPGLNQRLGENGSGYLQPIDQVVQVILPTDDLARSLTDRVVRACCMGELVPDQDYRQAWKAVLSRTAEHLRLGGHPE